ncbi:MAG: hypothetical protein K2W96_08175, partial [Gemmataceae bacterium]|nr:hypothetical protein [Gemmataceae bacterium]
MDDLGELRLELRCLAPPLALALAQGGGVMATACALAWLAFAVVPDQMRPVGMPIPPWAASAVVSLFAAGLFAFGAWGLRNDLRLRGLRVEVRERGLVLADGRSRETCRWEMVA